MRLALTMANAVNNFLPLLQFQGCSESQESENSASNNEDNQFVWCTQPEDTHTRPQGRQRRIHAHTHTRYHSLMGDVKGPAPPTVLAMTRSAICLRARRPEGLLPFVSWSWISPSSSSLNTCKQKQKWGHKHWSWNRPGNSCTNNLNLISTPPVDASGSAACFHTPLITTVHKSPKTY